MGHNSFCTYLTLLGCGEYHLPFFWIHAPINLEIGIVKKAKQTEKSDLDSTSIITYCCCVRCSQSHRFDFLTFHCEARSERKIFFNPSDQGQDLIYLSFPSTALPSLREKLFCNHLTLVRLEAEGKKKGTLREEQEIRRPRGHEKRERNHKGGLFYAFLRWTRCGLLGDRRREVKSCFHHLQDLVRDCLVLRPFS